MWQDFLVDIAFREAGALMGEQEASVLRGTIPQFLSGEVFPRFTRLF